MTGESLEINFSYINWSVTMKLRKQIRTYNSPGFLGSCKEVEPGTFSPSLHPQPVFVGNDHGYHVSALIHSFLKGCLNHSFFLLDISSKADKGQAKGGKAQQKTNNGGGKASSQQEKKTDVKQAKDPPPTTIVTKKVPTSLQREPEAGDNLASSSCGQKPVEDDVDLDDLAMELVAPRSYSEIRTDSQITSNIMSESVAIMGKPRLKIEQLIYLLSGALALYVVVRLASHSLASAVATSGHSSSVERAARRLHLLKMGTDIEAARQGVGPLTSTQTEPATLVEHREPDQGPPIPPLI